MDVEYNRNGLTYRGQGHMGGKHICTLILEGFHPYVGALLTKNSKT